MALPSTSQITVQVANPNLTIQYKPENLIGDSVWPIMPLSSPSQKILKYSKSNMFKIEPGTLYRSEGGETKIFDWDIETVFATPRQISAGESVPVEMIDVEQMPGQLPTNSIIDAQQHAMARLYQFKEKLIADTIYSNLWLDGTIGGSAPSAGNGGWSLQSTANSFIQDVFTAKAAILKATGVRPNVLVIDVDTFYAQQFNPIVSDKIKYTQRSIATAELLASLLQLDEVLVGASVYDGSNENKKVKSPATMTPIWNQSGNGQAYLFHKEAPGLRVLTAGLQYRLPYRGSLTYIEGYYDYRKRAYVYTATEQIDVAPVALDVGWTWTHTNK